MTGVSDHGGSIRRLSWYKGFSIKLRTAILATYPSAPRMLLETPRSTYLMKSVYHEVLVLDPAYPAAILTSVFKRQSIPH